MGHNSPQSQADGPPQPYSPLVLPIFNEEELLEEGADDVPKKTPKVVGELGQGVVAEAEDNTKATEGDVVAKKGDAIATNDGVVAEESSPYLSPNL